METLRKAGLDQCPAEVEELAASLRRLYVARLASWHSARGEKFRQPARHVPSWDGGTDSWGRTFVAVWPKMAELVLREKAAPERFLEAQFNDRVIPPTPAQCAGPAAVKKYADLCAKEESGSGVRKSLFRQVLVLRQKMSLISGMKQKGWSDNDILESSIRDESLEMSALFRWAVARRSDFPKLASRWFKKAVIQFRASPMAYASDWRELLDDRLVEELSAGMQVRPPETKQDVAPGPSIPVGRRIRPVV